MRDGIIEKARKYVMAGGTFAVAMGIGFFMQQGEVSAALDTPAQQSLNVARSITPVLRPDTQAALAAVTEVKAPVTIGASPRPVLRPAPETPETLILAAVVTPELDKPGAPNLDEAAACAPVLDVASGNAAMVAVSISAPCHADETFTLHHQGMMVTLSTDALGLASAEVPALSMDAVFIADFASGATAVAQTSVPDLAGYDRVVVQWMGDAGFELHALENGATYGDPGHVWSAAPRAVSAAYGGDGGFLTQLGSADNAEALLAEVYTFPSGIVTNAQSVELSVEAEITQANCGSEVAAQTLQISQDQPVLIRDVVLAIPGCEAQGSFMVIRDLVNDLVLASN